MAKKIKIILTLTAFLMAACITYDFVLSVWEGERYSKIINMIASELRSGKSAEAAIDNLKKNMVGLKIISITPVRRSGVYKQQEGKMVWMAGKYKTCEISCDVRSKIGLISGNRKMGVYMDEQNRTVNGVFAGM